MSNVYVVLALVSMVAASAPGQWTSPDKLLLPINPGRVQGAYGSEWLTDVAITNMSDSPIAVTRDLPGVCPALCMPLLLPARSTVIAQNIPQSPEVRGPFLFVEKGRTQGLGFPRKIPGAQRNCQVVMDAQFRSMLRIYDFNAETPGAVRVRVYALDPGDPSGLPDSDRLLVDFTPSFSVPSPGTEKIFPASAETALWQRSQQKAEGRKQKAERTRSDFCFLPSAFCLTTRGSGSG